MKLAHTFFLLFTFAATALAQNTPSVTAQPNTLYVGAEGKFEAAPDTVQIQFNVSVQEDTSQAAYQHASKDVEQVRAVLRANAIEPKAASIGLLSVQPVYDWKTHVQRLIGYRVTTDVLLKLKDFSKVGPLTQQLSDANVSESLSVIYTLENMDEAKNKAVEDAYHRARSSAETLARASGRALGELSYAAVDTFENTHYPVRRVVALAQAATAAATPAPTEEFTPQTVAVGAHINAVFNLK
jgi:uncharacterized protein